MAKVTVTFEDRIDDDGDEAVAIGLSFGKDPLPASPNDATMAQLVAVRAIEIAKRTLEGNDADLPTEGPEAA